MTITAMKLLAESRPRANTPKRPEEGHLTLSEEQISSAGIQLVEAKAQSISLSLPFPGEIRFDEDRTRMWCPAYPVSLSRSMSILVSR